jgi:3-oxoacyl-[acyl-carrier protein] reductase
MNIRLEGRVVLITGATGGIGQAAARLFAESGATVVAHYRSQADEAQRLIDSLPGVNHRKVHAELCDTNQITEMFTQIQSWYGQLDILINNAGYSARDRFLDTSSEALAQTMAVNFTAPFLCAKEAAQMMLQKGGGRILFVASVDGERPGSSRAHYASAKAAELQLMRNIACELAEYNVLVNAVSPGAIDTNMTAGVKQDVELLARVNKGIPLHRMGQPEEVASYLVFLCSDYAGYTTGANIVIDGGLSLTRGY